MRAIKRKEVLDANGLTAQKNSSARQKKSGPEGSGFFAVHNKCKVC